MVKLIRQWASKVKRTVLGDQVVRRMPLWYNPALHMLDTLSVVSIEERRAFGEVRLRHILQAAQKTAYGRQCGGGLQLSTWPLLSKEQVRSHPEVFLTVPAWLTVPASTSGTTGTPLKLYRSFPSIAVEQAVLDWLWRAAGLDPRRVRYAVLRGENIKPPHETAPPFWLVDLGGRRMVFSSNHLNAKTLPHFREALQRFQPECLFAYPSCAESLCRLLLSEGEPLHIPCCITSSEQPSLHLARLLQEALGARWVDYYGQAERVAFAYALQPGEYYFLPSYAIVELIPVAESGDDILYEIVGTSLWNRAMPLVRYRTGDLVRLPKSLGEREVEEICWGLRPFGGVEGRMGDYLLSPEGGVLMGIDHIPRDVDNVVRMQVIQERPDLVRILVIPDKGFSEQNIAQIQHNVALKLPPSMQVTIEVVDELERTAQNKTPFVIRRF
jgi:phenylacetate-CoA ligase